MVERRNAYSILVVKCEAMRPLGRPRCRWDDIRMELMEIGWEHVNWIHLAQNMGQQQVFVNMIMNFQVP
jgi:hypothetical protein